MINEIKIVDFSGYFGCHAKCCSASVVCHAVTMTFVKGVNILHGGIDSGSWGISQALSMPDKYRYERCSYHNIMEATAFYVDGRACSIEEIRKESCYLDRAHSLFRSNRPIKKLVQKGLKKSGVSYTEKEICELFELDMFRYERPLYGAGNEMWRIMSAIGLANGKTVFCFPWISDTMIRYFGPQIGRLLEKLEGLGVIAILPTDYNFTAYNIHRIRNFFGESDGFVDQKGAERLD